MVDPVVYLVTAALLIGLILFLTRFRAWAAAGKKGRRAGACTAASPGLLSLCRLSRHCSCACAGLLVGLTTISALVCACGASGGMRACAYARDGGRVCPSSRH